MSEDYSIRQPARRVRASSPASHDDGPALVISEADMATLTAYTAVLADGLRLQGWDVELVFDPRLVDAAATTEAPRFVQRATITLGRQFLADTPEDRRDTLVHELLHLTLMQPWQYVDELLEQELPARTARVAWLGFTSHMEASVDRLAAVFAPTLPLPPDLLPVPAV